MPQEEADSIGSAVKNRIKSLRNGQGLTQEQLAERLGVSRQTVNSIETGRHDPSLALAFAIARVFTTSVDDLFSPGEAGAPAKRSRATRRPPR